MSDCTITVSNSVRISAPGRAGVQAAGVRAVLADVGGEQPAVHPGLGQRLLRRHRQQVDVVARAGSRRSARAARCSPTASPVWSSERPLPTSDPSAGRSFHCLHATSHALQPMHTRRVGEEPDAPARGAGRRSRSCLAALRRRWTGPASRPDGRRRCPSRRRRPAASRSSPRAAPGAHLAGERLVLDRRVGIAGQHDQVVDRVAGDALLGGRVAAPVPRQRDLVDEPRRRSAAARRAGSRSARASTSRARSRSPSSPRPRCRGRRPAPGRSRRRARAAARPATAGCGSSARSCGAR